MWTKEDESSIGRVWAAGFHNVTARSLLARFENYGPFISLIFNYFRASEPTDTELEDKEGTTVLPNKYCSGERVPHFAFH
jgi:hypothetical protein